MSKITITLTRNEFDQIIGSLNQTARYVESNHSKGKNSIGYQHLSQLRAKLFKQKGKL